MFHPDAHSSPGGCVLEANVGNPRRGARVWLRELPRGRGAAKRAAEDSLGAGYTARVNVERVFMKAGERIK
jgi:hypothetical protein